NGKATGWRSLPVEMTTEFKCISLAQSPFYPDTYRLMSDKVLRPHEGDQVVPSSQRRIVLGAFQQREPKPLPPLPDPEELMSDEAADNEVEFFTSDRKRLLPKSCPKASSQGNNRDYGQVNHAYQERFGEPGPAMAFSWPGREDRTMVSGSAGGFSPLYRGDQQLRFSFSDKPPKIPPRVPLVPPCPPRTPSPKSLPIYINGVMPATQSFAANPKYVSKALQRQHSERTPPAAHFSPCIVPILKDGRQASATHYILLPPGRPPHTDRRERLLSEPAGMGSPNDTEKSVKTECGGVECNN
uniref:ERBB receptor feedback inhibitor 1a n=1 Tax=Cynoglossus semilaevis TaxID=244447 RepID=A0A3P8WZU6_CYNSE